MAKPLTDNSEAVGFAASADELREAFQLLQQAENLRARGQLDRARTICEPLVNRYPDYFGALHTLGLIYADKGQYPQALGCLVRACMLDPQNWKSLTALSGVYLELGASEMAARALELAKEIKPDDAGVHLTLAEIYRSEREYELARDAYRSACELDSTLSAAAAGLANCLIDLGDYGEAVRVLNALTDRGVKELPVLALLNRLPAHSAPTDILLELEKLQAPIGADKANFENSIAFARAQALDKAGRHDEAWETLVRANCELWPRMQERARGLAINQRANLVTLSDRRIDIGESKTGQPVSLFIVGASRSGKTTLETLLSALAGVKRGYENPAVENAVRRTFQSAGLLTHRIFEILPAKHDEQCRKFYLEELNRRARSAKVFTNTHPGRIHDAARIASALPNTRFIFVKRNLEDNLLRVLMQKYEVGHPDAYDLKAARNSILWYHEMIDLLVAKLPGISRVVHYEEMVADPHATLRVAADLCGLPRDALGSLPPIGDDRGCAKPYREQIAEALSA